MTRLPIWLALAISFVAGATLVHFALNVQWHHDEVEAATPDSGPLD